jgi:hypothetical protein
VSELSTDQLLKVQAEADSTLTSLVDTLSERPDMQQVLRKLMSPDDMLETFSEQAIADPDLMRVTLQASVATLINLHTHRAATAELKRRAEGN